MESKLEIAVQYCKTAVLGYVCQQFAVKRGCCNGPAHEGYDSAWEIRFRSEHDPHRVQAWVLYTEERVSNTFQACLELAAATGDTFTYHLICECIT